METITTQLHAIGHHLAGAQAHLARIQQMMDRIAQEGMYDAVPTESWQDRGGPGRYLYHYFPQDRTGASYLGPDGKKKLYIGVEPARIKEARRLAHNRRRYNTLNQAAAALQRWLGYRQTDLNNLAAHAPCYPRFDFRQIADD